MSLREVVQVGDQQVVIVLDGHRAIISCLAVGIFPWFDPRCAHSDAHLGCVAYQPLDDTPATI